MPAKKPDDVPETPAPRVVRECPACNATIFQGPFNRGEIANGVLEPREVLYQCVRCNRVLPLSEIPERVSLAGTL